MEKFKKSGPMETKSGDSQWNWYPVNILLLIFILPVVSIWIESIIKAIAVDPGLMGKWFIFWTVGIRLSAAGIKQVFSPGFTATQIFHMKTKESFVVIRELGFANISIGLMGILSVINSEWRQIAGIAGALFFGLAGIQHFFRKPVTNREMIAMVTDLLVFTVILMYLFFTLWFSHENM